MPQTTWTFRQIINLSKSPPDQLMPHDRFDCLVQKGGTDEGHGFFFDYQYINTLMQAFNVNRPEQLIGQSFESEVGGQGPAAIDDLLMRLRWRLRYGAAYA